LEQGFLDQQLLKRMDFAPSVQPRGRDNLFYSAMNIAHYYRTRATELRREAEDTLDANVKQSKLETAEAFERLLADRLVAEVKGRRPRNAGAAQSVAAGSIREK
jgi:hypothetical protein